MGGIAHSVKCQRLAKIREFAHTHRMSLVRTMYAIMASRKPVTLSDGRTGVIVRVDTSFPEAETTLHVWTEMPEGPGLAKVSARAVVETGTAKKSA
jgi:hypothetical protein